MERWDWGGREVPAQRLPADLWFPDRRDGRDRYQNAGVKLAMVKQRTHDGRLLLRKSCAGGRCFRGAKGDLYKFTAWEQKATIERS